MPIDAIYAYIERDYEEQGYSDSMCNADNSYKEAKKTGKSVEEIVAKDEKRKAKQAESSSTNQYC